MMGIIKIFKSQCFYPPRTPTDASIVVYKFRPERTGFNMYAEYTRQQLTFPALQPCYRLCETTGTVRQMNDIHVLHSHVY